MTALVKTHQRAASLLSQQQQQPCRSGLDAILDCEIASLIADAASGSRSRNRAVAHLLERFGGRVSLAQLCSVAIAMQREQAAEIEQFATETHRLDIELGRLSELRRVQGW
jgi:hypothetical protein